MDPATPDLASDDLAFVCDEPACELARGPLGLTTAEIQARVLALREPAPEPAEPDDPDELEEEDAGELDEADDDPADPTAIDPLGEGAPCPLCRAARPPRTGRLLAIPHRGTYARVLAATTGFFGLSYWQLVESDSTTGTNRQIDAQRRALGEAARSKATTSFVVGRKLITAVVLKELPFDGHVLRLGNRDADVFEYVEVAAARGKKKRKKLGWARGTATYGVDQAPPGAGARANPIYVRELQEDLIWLGYLSTTRGSPTPGKFDVYTLGAVLGFKQDLAEIYGVATSAKRLSVTPGSVRAGEFTTAIWYQAAFVSPVRIILDWRAALRGRTKGRGAAPVVQALARGVKDRLARAKNGKSFRAHLATLEQRRATLEDLMNGWPHLAALDGVDRPFTPFAPKDATKTVAELADVPAGKRPKHADRAALEGDAIWSAEEYNARAKNRQDFFADLRQVLAILDGALDDIAEARARMAELAAPAEVAAEWATARPVVDATLGRLAKLLALVEFWVLDSPTQMKAWLDHIADMGTVDQPTAVYLKALREGGKIGPDRRAAYQLKPLTGADEFVGDDGARYLRDECIGRARNESGGKGETMPEIVALQFFGNESSLKFTRTLAPFNTRAEDGATRLVLMGIDTNAHRKGSFDAIFHAGGDWYRSRGWGVGQATEGDGALDGVRLRRGLPILPGGADNVQHPRSFVDREDSVADAMERKILAKYNGRTARRDCTLQTSRRGSYYDCHTCLKRFFEDKLTGTGEYGRGGVFVPVRKDAIGSPDRATGFFVDLERYTPFARAGGAAEDPAGASLYRTLFGIELDEASADVVAVLRRMDGKTTIAGAVKALAKARKTEQGVELDEDALVAGVKAHVAARSQLPCSWLLVRMLYAGTGEQAFSSIHDLLRVVGDLQSSNATLIEHIKEASELRRKA